MTRAATTPSQHEGCRGPIWPAASVFLLRYGFGIPSPASGTGFASTSSTDSPSSA